MRKLKSVLFAVMIVLMASCGNNTASEFTTVKVKEVIQVSGYTYLLVKSKGPEYWVAVPTMEASPGETYHYQGGMLMPDFYSSELDRTFDEVLFLEAIFEGDGSSSSLAATQMPGNMSDPHQGQGMTPGSQVTVEKADVAIEAVEGVISIADLFANPSAYEGKSIRVRGEVTKFNPAIMERNWVHIQDGTEFQGRYDLTATSSEAFEVGSVVTLEGIVALDLDFGYGYSYEILLESSTAIN